MRVELKEKWPKKAKKRACVMVVILLIILFIYGKKYNKGASWIRYTKIRNLYNESIRSVFYRISIAIASSRERKFKAVRNFESLQG